MRDKWPRGKKWLKLAPVDTIAREQLRQMATTKETKEEMDDNVETEGTWLPYHLLFKIFLLLPAETLSKLRCVSKTLLNMIDSPTFIEAQFRQSETVLITRYAFHEVNIQSPFPLPSDKPNHRCYFHFWEMCSGKGHKVHMPNLRNLECILAACNGLVLARIRKNGGLLVINPSTRNHIRLPLGTIGFVEECYGFMFNHLTGGYKVVHLFHDKSRNIRCEILNLTTRSWHAVDGPNSAQFGSVSTTHRSVSAVGALYWLPKRDSCNHVVSLGFHNEKFVTVSLPISSTKNDRLVAIGSSLLSFVTHATLNLIQVWVLKRDGLKENWIKRYSINRFYDITGFVPLCASTKEMFFKRKGYPLLHIYNLEAEEMQEVNFEAAKRNDEEEEDELELDIGDVGDVQHYMPHVKSLVSWDTPQIQWDA